jgi:thioredoxin 1
VSRVNKVIITALVLGAAGAVVFIKAIGPEASESAAGRGAVAEARLPRLVDLGSNTCIPCKMMAPILTELKEEYAGALVVEVIDVRENRLAAAEHRIRVIPTQIFYDAQGAERFRHEGFMSKEALLIKWRELGVDLRPPASAAVGQ